MCVFLFQVKSPHRISTNSRYNFYRYTWQTAINLKCRPLPDGKIGPLKVNNNPRERSRQPCRRGLTSRTLARITSPACSLFFRPFPAMLVQHLPRTPSGKNDEPIEIHVCTCAPVCAVGKANWIHRLTANEWQHKETANLAWCLAKLRLLNPFSAILWGH